MKYTIEFKTIEEMIKCLSENEKVLGILEYGTRRFDNMGVGGDYDFSIVTETPISQSIGGIHFHVNNVPVDCMFVCLSDLKVEVPENPYLMAHINSRVLFDRTGEMKQIVSRINRCWLPQKALSDSETQLFRFTFQHIIDKLENRLFNNPLYSRYFIYSSLDWILECYSRINNLIVGKPRDQFDYMMQSNPELYSRFQEIYVVRELEEQFDLLKEICSEVLINHGGLWKTGEILVHLNPEYNLDKAELEEIIHKLFDF